MPQALSSSRTVALVVAAADINLLITRHLHHHDFEVHLTTSYGGMAEALFDVREQRTRDNRILFVLDLRISCGAAVIDARLRDYDAALNDYLLSGRPWPKTLCLVEVKQTHPIWLRARPHLRATLLADEVEALVGGPEQRKWHEGFAHALRRCLTE